MEKLVKEILTLRKKPHWSWPKDLLVKILSLFFAIFLWYFVAGEDRVDMTVKVPVEIVNLPHHLIISNQFKNELEVTVSGARSLIRSIDKKNVIRSIDLTEATPGNMAVRNGLDSIKFPRGIKTIRIQPTNITLLLDQLVQKDIQIKYATSGELSDNYILESIKIDPDHLTVSGPSETFKDIQVLKTEPIDLASLTNSTTKQLHLKLADDLAKLTGESAVTATIKIKEKFHNKDVENIIIAAIGTAEGFYAMPTPSTITLTARITNTRIKGTVDLRTLFSASINTTNLGAGTHTLKVQINKPPKITVTDFKPKTVQVEIWEKKTKKKFN
jgi:YbbR domain-containing protein